jgi:hypothetical protein
MKANSINLRQQSLAFIGCARRFSCAPPQPPATMRRNKAKQKTLGFITPLQIAVLLDTYTLRPNQFLGLAVNSAKRVACEERTLPPRAVLRR